MKPLSIERIPLFGRHLIEASAGTGKTWNITRLYLRLLLQKQLGVQQILVLTFTRAATEELRGRIEAQLREALSVLDSKHCARDSFYDHLFGCGKSDTDNKARQTDSATSYRAILQLALLELDEAAIFTIHGFCARVLSTQAFSSGLPMNLDMQTYCEPLLLQAVCDWYRKIQTRKNDYALLQTYNLEDPQKFYQQYLAALQGSGDLYVADTNILRQERDEKYHDLLMQSAFEKQMIQKKLCTDSNITLISHSLIKNKKDQEKREREWQTLMHWLDDSNTFEVPDEVGQFINGNRYRGNDAIKELFAPIKDLRTSIIQQCKDIDEQYNEALARLPFNQLIGEAITEIRTRFQLIKQNAQILDFTDLIQIVNQQLHDPQTSEQLVEKLRKQFPVALVDEFQDTDPQQYGIFAALYPPAEKDDSKNHALYMIGDPKQAIYAFRGGDIFTYLQARTQADFQWHMDTNWRSLESVVRAYNHLFLFRKTRLEAKAEDNTPPAVFDFDIDYYPVRHTPLAKAAQTRLTDRRLPAGGMYYYLQQNIDNPSGARGNPVKQDWQNALAKWCVKEILALLQYARLGTEQLKEEDIAILVRTSSEAWIMRQYLLQNQLGCVYLSERESVLQSDEAREILWVLRGIWEVENDYLLTRALACRLLGGNPERLAHVRQEGGEQQWEALRDAMFSYRALWLKKGCMALLLTLISQNSQPQPLAYERALTNYLHLAEILQKGAQENPHPGQLIKWFSDQILSQVGEEETQLRLESDDKLIKIITCHGSKGLEYPVVFLPFASFYKDPIKQGRQIKQYFVYHDPQTQIPVHEIGASNRACDAVTREDKAESLRLFYVAVTRATHRCYIGLAASEQSELSAPGILLGLKDNNDWLERLQQLTEKNQHSILLTEDFYKNDQAGGQLSSRQADLSDRDLQAARFDNLAALRDHWRLTSYSALARGARLAWIDRREIDEAARSQSTNLRNRVKKIAKSQLPIRFSLTPGAQTGAMLHEVLQGYDFQQDNEPVIRRVLARYGSFSDTQISDICAWLTEVAQTRLPSMPSTTGVTEVNQADTQQGFSLAQIPFVKTLREVEFYFPARALPTRTLLQLLHAHRREVFAQSVLAPSFDSIDIEGMIKGVIDLVFEYQGRYYLADYKSTILGECFEAYAPAALMMDMQQHHYDLQYVLYALALHRYLRAQLQNYQPEKHFGGVYYFYLRGMSDQNKIPYGVFFTPLSTEFLTRLDKLFGDQRTQT